MVEDITKIPQSELESDLADTVKDILVCQAALKVGIDTYGKGDSTQHRLDVNLRIERMITNELNRRKNGEMS